MNTARVLIVDDDEQMRSIVRRSVDSYKVIGEAVNGRDGVALAEQLQPDIILMDISMPVMNGFEAVRLLRERMGEVLIIFITMHLDRAYVDEATRLGVQGYVIKRAVPVELPNAMKAVLAGDTYRSPLVAAGH